SRDFLTQLRYAIRETIGSALVCVACATLVGVVVGATAGYIGGWFDALITWATGAIVAVPALAVLIIVSVWARVPPSPLTYGLWLGALLWPGVARWQRRPSRRSRSERLSRSDSPSIPAAHWWRPRDRKPTGPVHSCRR